MSLFGGHEYRDVEGVPGWEVRETPTICDGLVVRWNLKCDRGIPGRFEVSASRNGVMVSGYMGRAVANFDNIVAVLRMAESAARSMGAEQ